ncbi:MAG: hypothetical protein EBU90_00755 [Proteobacteria bacterium]|nr:hypothetical protein [Pseudomonadota bacterium]NBP12962.1 hypothetical protein [bacterium]
MPKTPIYYPPIGISGAALVGKDTFCSCLSMYFELKSQSKIKAKRCSIAGDVIRKDLKELILKKLGVEIDPTEYLQKTLLRPLMVEYGRYMRNQTEGRYFIETLNKNKQFAKNFVPIIPDIRYAEFEKDELYWLKNEKKGILIFLERNGIKPANEFEEKNNILLKQEADFVFEIPNFKDMTEYCVYINDKVEKVVTTYLQGISQP